jgi:lysophospholipase L1-like esterase
VRQQHFAFQAAAQIVAFGDSLVVGFGTTSGNNFVSLLSSRIGISIVNAGRLGDTTGSALNRLQSDVISRQPKIVIVLLGGNDLLQNVPLQQRVSNITSIAQQIRHAGATVILVGLGNDPIDPYGGACRHRVTDRIDARAGHSGRHLRRAGPHVRLDSSQ